MQKHEYKVIRVIDCYYVDPELALRQSINDEANDEWELVSTQTVKVDGERGTRLYFKRPIG